MAVVRAVARAVVTSITAIALVSAPGAGVAAAETGGSITFPTPDLAYMRPGCTTELSWDANLTPVVRPVAEGPDAAGYERIDLTEYGQIRVTSTGCGPVVWEPNVDVLDDSVVSGGDRGYGAGGVYGNPASASAAQVVTYGVGEREAGEITFTFWATSRLGQVCIFDKWTFDAATKTPLSVGSFACGIDPRWHRVSG